MVAEEIKNNQSIKGSSKTKSTIEKVMSGVFLVCGLVSVASVVVITMYMIISGGPAIAKVGVFDFLFGQTWAPTATDPQFGILPMILTSIVGTLGAIIVGVPIGILTAVYIAELASDRMASIVRPAISLLAGIPSVIYGLIGMIIVVPLVNSLFPEQTQYNGGATLFVAIIVLSIMILPTIISVSESAIKSVPKEFKEASYGIGATKLQTIFKVVIPAAKSGIATSIVLGIGRAIGEAMAVIMVSGNVANMPKLFGSVRFLTTGIVSEMSYAADLHREVLFSIGLILFVFIMVINILLNVVLKKGGSKNG